MNKIFVTSPSLPPLEEFIPYLEDIWKEKWLTNMGKYHIMFEKALADYLGVKHISLFCNGMIALQVGLQALRVAGEIITTPFTFAATTHAIYWNNCTPVFCDIDQDTFNIDPDKIESLITPKTTAIMPVHVYGTPCNTEKIQKIAETYGLKVFYDAAHAFGVKKDGQSILNCGDLSMLSFHATKCFNTFEGGALVTNDEKLKTRIDYLKNFGFADETTVVAPGTNGKLDEFRSAFGLLQLKYIDNEISKRKNIFEIYYKNLKNVQGITLSATNPCVKYNYSYFPIRIDEKYHPVTRDKLYENLKKNNIFARRYFYPITSNFACYQYLNSAEKGKLPFAEKISKQILCLPISSNIETVAVEKIISIIRDV